LHWRQRDSVETGALHLYLHPNFLRTTAESIDFDYSQIRIAWTTPKAFRQML
jgi:hypothetical protein